MKPVKKVLILFPDNPEEKFTSKFRYEKNIVTVEFTGYPFSDGVVL